MNSSKIYEYLCQWLAETMQAEYTTWEIKGKKREQSQRLRHDSQQTLPGIGKCPYVACPQRRMLRQKAIVPVLRGRADHVCVHRRNIHAY